LPNSQGPVFTSAPESAWPVSTVAVSGALVSSFSTTMSPQPAANSTLAATNQLKLRFILMPVGARLSDLVGVQSYGSRNGQSSPDNRGRVRHLDERDSLFGRRGQRCKGIWG